MRLQQLELTGFKSFAKKTSFAFDAPVTAIVGPNGSGKSNCAEAFRWVLGEKSMKSLRGRRGEDLIWNGSPVGGLPRAGRGAVTLVFDNRDRKFNLDFDEVAITREVYRDGQNSYLINGSVVRYRDIVELLAGVSLGSSDHYIVNQGDADRILSANLRERRSMVEDALGLRLYQWKIEESRKKLEQTEENRKQVESLRRELGPHLKYLAKQVEKIEQTDRLRRELKGLYLEYLKREDAYLRASREALAAEQSAPAAELRQVEAKLAELAQVPTGAVSAVGERLGEVDQELRFVAERKEELARQLWRLEGALEVREAENRERAVAAAKDFPHAVVTEWVSKLEAELTLAERLADVFSLQSALGRLRTLVASVLERSEGAPPADPAALETTRRELAEINERLAEVRRREDQLLAEREELRRQVAREKSQLQDAEREVFELRARKGELHGRLSAGEARAEKLRLEEEDFRRELTEGVVLVDQEIKRYEELAPAVTLEEERALQEERRRKIERLKIRLEDSGVESGDTMKEYDEATARDAYLAKEIADLTAGAAALETIIAELGAKINHDFQEGIEKINRYFQEFFALMFGGGTASLAVVKERSRAATSDLAAEFLSEDEGPKDEGIEINVNLPRKKIRGLDMLSGGERALTSIALLFAMSQVNPPPFLILDETDAALDEANSRKYSELVANLSQHSQLILITHNRETMSRADLIYGITMGADGVSKQLSIKFDDAAAYAK
jgi:chromosome segregation protein